MTPYQQYIHKSRYARYLPDKKRRETWEETVDRYITFFKGRVPKNSGVPWTKLREAIVNMEVMPSMRCLMTAGPALERDNVAGYNCAYVAVDDQRVFDEIMYILLCGTGVGFSVERQYINKLPQIAEEFHNVDTTITVPDSKMGWASSLRQLIGLLYQGQVPEWNLDRIRPAGAPLRTFGGRASGPAPLDDLFKWTVSHFRRAAGRRFNSLEVHDLVCKIAGAVVVGGVRRSALISLSNLTDERMRHAKSGEWYFAEPQRALANNSIAYTERPDTGAFMREWLSLYDSKSGERGFFARYAITVPERREVAEWGTNPCSEIILRSKQFCNLTEVVLREEDKYEDIERKVELATILGTLQATLTNFRYLSRRWKENTEEEALLGVSLTGIMDNAWLSTEPSSIGLQELKLHAISVNQKYAKKFGINCSASITCVKPSGTVSQLVDSASGIHPRYASFYIRRVRADKSDPLCTTLIEAGVPYETDNHNPQAWVFSFPMRAPDHARTVDDMTAIEQLEHWMHFDEHWCEHKPSVSIYVREHEWPEVGGWVYNNIDRMSGVSFFPLDDHVYPQAPYEKIDKETYEAMLSLMPPEINLDIEEEQDDTTGSQEYACTGNACEL
jgi:ribonucleoside-diphosphate reductase alpha chain